MRHMSDRFTTLRPIEQRFIAKLAAHRDHKPEHELDAHEAEGKPAVADGRLVRIRLYSAPRSIDLRGLDALVAVESVVELRPGGTGERAGLHVGDVIKAIDGRDVTALTAGGLLRLIGTRAVGDIARVAFLRGGAAVMVALPVAGPWWP